MGVRPLPAEDPITITEPSSVALSFSDSLKLRAAYQHAPFS